ncbi:MAG TPA: hypothetical protein VIK52_08245 [Opitutaceae bacterium]
MLSPPSTQSAPAPRPSVVVPAPPRVTLDAAPGIGPPSIAIAGWVEWVSPDGRSAVIELAAPVDPPAGRVWWVRDEELKPLAIFAIQPPRRGLRLGAVVTQGQARVGAEVLSGEPRLAPKIPPLQSGASK